MQLAFTLDASAECTGIHPDEQLQGVVVMPDEHFHAPVEVCLLSVFSLYGCFEN